MSFLINIAERTFAAVRRTTPPYLQESIISVGTNDRTGQSACQQVRLKALETLLLDLFSRSEFERFFVEHYAFLRPSINFGGSPADIVFAAVDVWRRHRLIGDELYLFILNKRPHAADEIKQVFSLQRYQ